MTIETKFFYANALELGTSPYEIGLKFMRLGTSTPDTPRAGQDGQELQSSVLDALHVSMSPSHAKAMLPALVNSVLDYEKKYGKIPLSSESRDKWDALLAVIKAL